MADRTLRGYNGSLSVGTEAIRIKRGLRGLIARKHRDPELRISLSEVAAVRFAPSGWLVGYLQIVGRASPSSGDDYLSIIRDVETVTFLTRSNGWRRVAEEIAARSGAPLEVSAAAPGWSTIRGASLPMRRRGW